MDELQSVSTQTKCFFFSTLRRGEELNWIHWFDDSPFATASSPFLSASFSLASPPPKGINNEHHFSICRVAKDFISKKNRVYTSTILIPVNKSRIDSMRMVRDRRNNILDLNGVDVALSVVIEEA